MRSRASRAPIAAAAALGLGVTLAALARAGGAAAAGMPGTADAADAMDLATPIDPAVHTGRLANGLTTYALRRGKPEDRAALWLLVDVGAVMEERDQRGLAHFVEHMAFAGTRRFPRRDIFDLLEKAGMTLGPDANGRTTLDYTVYQLTVPTGDGTLVRRALDMLRDIAGDVTFDPAEVDKERRVVLEEARLRRGAGERTSEQQSPILFRGSRYADRLAAGTSAVKTATPAALARFYKTWYRPELMAVIAVGDVDPAAVQADIAARFADLPASDRPLAHPAVPVPIDHPPAIAIAVDAEARFSSVTVYDKVEHSRDASKRDFRRILVERLLATMEEGRLAELRDDLGSPLVGTSAGRRNLSRTLDAFTVSVTAKEGQLDAALRLVFREMSRIERYGFWQSERARARKILLARMERVGRERDKAPLADLAWEMGRNFLSHEQMPPPGTTLDWVRELLPTITLAEINELAQPRPGGLGRVIAISAPSSARALPSEAEVAAMAKQAAEAPLPPWRDTTPDHPLLASTPAPGKVTGVTRDAGAGATVWRLANGVRVVVKPTTSHNDSVGVVGWQSGGTSLVSDDDFVQARFADEIVSESGAGTMSERELRKLLAGKSLSVHVGLSELHETVRANARPEDLEAMLQVLYLRLAQPRAAPGSATIWRGKALESVRHRDSTPEQRLADEVAVLASGDHPRRRPMNAEMIARVDAARALAVWNQRFGDLGAFTFVFVGNVDPRQLQPLVETYLGSLPSHGRRDQWKDLGISPPAGKVEKTIAAGREPKSRVWLEAGAPAKWSLEAERDARVLQTALRIRMREVLREDLGGVYDVTVRARMIREPAPRRALQIAFGCAPDNVDKLRGAVFDELAAVARHGVGDGTLAKVREQLRRQHEVDLTDDGWWLVRLRDAYEHGDDFARANDVGALVARVTDADIQATAARMFDGRDYILAVLRPETPPAAPAPTAAAPAPTAPPAAPPRR